MTPGMRWRIVTLQALLALVFAAAAVFLYSEGHFVNGMVHDQLAAQKVYFPPRGSPALDPAEFPDLQRYAGQPVDDGDRAKAYADGFIGRHLKAIAGGKTYAQVSAEAQANPNDPTLAAEKTTLFQGETLRGLLLNAWGWSQVARYTIVGSAVMALAAIAMLAALLYEVAVAPRPVAERATRRQAA